MTDYKLIRSKRKTAAIQIRGGEVIVPDLRMMTLAETEKKMTDLSLSLSFCGVLCSNVFSF